VTPRLLTAILLAAALSTSSAGAARASAFTAAAGRATADRAAGAWARAQRPDGAFVDPVSRRPTYGYSDVMIGYGLLRAGARRHDDRLTGAGFRAIAAALRHGPPKRGVFDALAHSTAYEFALRELPRDRAFEALRPTWERYLRGVSAPFIRSTGLQACTADPRCFHNHEAVGAFGDLRLLRTGLRSRVPGAKLADPAALRAAALRVVGEEIPAAASTSATSTQGDPRRGLGLLSDTGTWPLAYHSFSTAMLAGAAAELGGGELPPATRRTLLGIAHAMAAMMAPDGDVAYLGRRQQQAWALASAVYAGVVAARLPGQDARARGELRAAADRAFARLVSANRFGPGGIGAVPRPLSPRTGYHGVDANEVVPSALVIFLLNLAADEADAGSATPGARPGSGPPPAAAPLPADSDGAFLEPDRTGFAAVRHGDLWYAVHRRTITYDLRYDFGLVALKRRDARGRWHDVVRPRPNTRGPSHDSAGPVILKGGVRYLPYGETIAVRPGGVVLVRGGFRSEEGAWLRRGVTFRFEPVAGGVRMRFPLRAGDAARVVTFLPQREARRRGRFAVADAHSVSSLSLRPDGVRFGRGYASCCDEHLVAATMSLRPGRDATVSWTVRSRGEAAAEPAARAGARQAGGRGAGGRDGGGGSSTAALAGGAAAGLAIAGVALAARRRRRRSVGRIRR
jgi:hypothetical protein